MPERILTRPIPNTDHQTFLKTMYLRVSFLLLILAGLAVVFTPLPIRFPAPQERTFRIDARQFAYSPSELNVNPGDKVTIQLVSTDVVHGLYIDGYNVSVEADPGQTATLTFVANQPGSFRFRCNITCGAMHPFMIGKLNVGTNITLLRASGLAVLGMISVMLFTKNRIQAVAES